MEILRDLLFFTASFGICIFFFVRRKDESTLINPDFDGSFFEKILSVTKKIVLFICFLFIFILSFKYYDLAFPETPEEIAAREQRIAERKVREEEERQAKEVEERQSAKRKFGFD